MLSKDTRQVYEQVCHVGAFAFNLSGLSLAIPEDEICSRPEADAHEWLTA